MRSVLALAAVALDGGCDAVLGPGREIRLPITAIVAPDEIASNVALTVRVTIVSGGCRRFDQLRVTRTTNRATMVAHGFDHEGPGVNCPADIREDTREFSLSPPLADPFTLAAKQPNGSELRHVVRVLSPD